MHELRAAWKTRIVVLLFVGCSLASKISSFLFPFIFSPTHTHALLTTGAHLARQIHRTVPAAQGRGTFGQSQWLFLQQLHAELFHGVLCRRRMEQQQWQQQ